MRFSTQEVRNAKTTVVEFWHYEETLGCGPRQRQIEK